MEVLVSAAEFSIRLKTARNINRKADLVLDIADKVLKNNYFLLDKSTQITT